MRLLVCGSRNWRHYEPVLAWVEHLYPDVVIEGEAHGADTLGRRAAVALGIPVERYPAQRKIYGKRAGPIRNQQMLDEGKPDLVLAFSEDIEHSTGTKDMIRRSLKANLEVILIENKEQLPLDT